MTLTVRLDDTLKAALERHCLDTGMSKSLAVQESLAVYLLDKPNASDSKARAAPAAPSANYAAFAAAGLVGGIALGQGADKAAVRARMAASLARRRK